MKKITLGLTLLLSFSVLPGAVSSARADAKSFETNVNGWVTQSQAARKPCMDYQMGLSKLNRARIPVFKDKATALAVMKVLARNPGIPAASSRAFSAAMATLPAGIDWSWFTRAYGMIPGACGVIQSYDGMNRLINSTRVLGFSKAERARVRATALSFISKNVNQPAPLIVGLVQVALFENLAATRLVTLDAKSTSQLKALLQQGERVRGQVSARVRSRKKATDQERASDLIFELKYANQLRTRFLPLLAKAQAFR